MSKHSEEPERIHPNDAAADRPADEIMSALADCIQSAPADKQGALARALENYPGVNKSSWTGLIGPRHQGSLFNRMFWTLIEATDPWRTDL